MLEVYREVTGDFPAKELVDFYKSYRACLRAKLAVWHLRDDGRLDPQKWLARARSYLEIARGYAETLD
jgi:aminoglycoside phosphotransferase family enzyme